MGKSPNHMWITKSDFKKLTTNHLKEDINKQHLSLTLLLTCINSSCKIYKNFWFLSYQQIWVFFFPCLVMMESLTRRRMAGSPSSLVFCWKTAGCYLQQRSLGTGFHCPSFSSATSSVALESVVRPFLEHFSSHSPGQTGTSSQTRILQSVNQSLNQSTDTECRLSQTIILQLVQLQSSLCR